MKKNLILLVCSSLFLGACGLPIGLPHDYRYAGELSKDDLVGIWVLDAKSVGILLKGGAHYYLRQTDHVFMLKDDGSCAYRGFGSDLPPYPVFGMSEEAAYTQPYSGRPIPIQYLCWYGWNTNGVPVISGPLHSPDTTPGVISLPSRYTVWYFDDWGARISRRSEESIRTRYDVCLALSIGGTNDRGSSDQLYVGKDSQGIFLWELGPLNSYAVPENTLVYRRVTMSELHEMLRSGK